MNRVFSYPLRLLLLCAGTLFVQAQSSTLSERLLFSFDSDGQLRMQINASESLSASDLRKAGPIVRDGVTLQARNEAVRFSSARRPLVFEVAGPGGFRGTLPSLAEAEAILAKDGASITAGSANRANIRLEFSDSAQAELPPGGSGRAEFFGNATYAFAGSTNVTATTADGQTLRFGRGAGPMLGGPLVRQTDARGTPRLSRASPLVRVDFSGSPEREVLVQSAALSGALLVGQDRLLTFENGAQALLRHDAAGAAVHWKVLRGVVQFGIGGFSCWRAVANSGQSGTLQWSAERRVADLKHGPGDGFVNVQLSGRISASVAPGATFQYAQFQDCGSFSTGALGDVVLHDRESGESIPILQSAITYNEGQRTGPGAAARPGTWHPVGLSWDSDARVMLRGAGSTYPVNAGMEDTIHFASDELHARYDSNGALTLRAVDGNFTLVPAFLPDLSVDIPDGGALVLRLNRQRLLFTAQAAEDSGASLRVVHGGQTYMYLSGEARITVVLGQNSLIPEGSPAWIFFEGAGGETLFTSGQQPGVLIDSSRIDVSRIQQEPVSVIE